MRFFGEVGYAETFENAPGVWQEKVFTRRYTGDVLKNVSQMQSGENLNDDLNISNRFSIVADSFAYENFYRMRYIYWLGEKWKVKSVEVQRPRLILTVGGVYNDQTSRTPC